MIENTEMKIFDRQKSFSSKENEKLSTKADKSLMHDSANTFEDADNGIIKCRRNCGEYNLYLTLKFKVKSSDCQLSLITQTKEKCLSL